MSNSTQAHNLYNLLVAAGSAGISRSEISKHLGVSEGSVPVYVFGLKKFFNAKIENVKDGRKVVAYKLNNASDIQVPAHRLYRRNDNGVVVLSNPNAGITKPVKATKIKVTKVTKKKITKVVAKKPKAEKVDNDFEITELSNSDFSDIKSALGIN